MKCVVLSCVTGHEMWLQNGSPKTQINGGREEWYNVIDMFKSCSTISVAYLDGCGR